MLLAFCRRAQRRRIKLRRLLQEHTLKLLSVLQLLGLRQWALLSKLRVRVCCPVRFSTYTRPLSHATASPPPRPRRRNHSHRSSSRRPTPRTMPENFNEAWAHSMNHAGTITVLHRHQIEAGPGPDPVVNERLVQLENSVKNMETRMLEILAAVQGRRDR